MTLQFTDKQEFDTSGPLRTLKRPDGWYIVGQGFLIPVEDEADGLKCIQELSESIKIVSNHEEPTDRTTGESKISGQPSDKIARVKPRGRRQ